MKMELQGNAITKDGKGIATVDGNTVFSAKPLGPRDKGEIKKLLGLDEITWEAQKQDEEEAPQLTDAQLLAMLKERGLAASPQVAPKSISVPTEELTKDKALAAIRARAGNTEPQTHPFMGDKDPVFVEWVRTNGTEDEYKAIYAKMLARGVKFPSYKDHEDGERKRRAAVFAKAMPEKADQEL